MANEREGDSADSSNGKEGFRKFIPQADISNAIATFALVLVGIWGVLETKTTVELSERAWISTTGVSVSEVPQVGQPLHYTLQFINSGKEPAVDINYAQTQGLVDPPQNNDFAFMTLPHNDTCNGLQPADGVVTAPNTMTIRGQDTGRGDKPLYINDAVMAGDKWIYVQGCLAYRTFGKPHTSGYCYVVEINPKPRNVQETAVQGTAIAPPQGGGANSSPAAAQPGGRWVATSCRDGFSAG